jgi:hypothetical protein
LSQALIAERLMGTLLVVPLQPVPNDSPRILEIREQVLPDTLFLETAEEPFKEPILFRRAGRDELLLQALLAIGLPKAEILKDEPIVTPQHRRAHRTERAEPRETGRFHRPLCLLRGSADEGRIAVR